MVTQGEKYKENEEDFLDLFSKIQMKVKEKEGKKAKTNENTSNRTLSTPP